ncbi:hypothetical protein L1987_78706 [Smallanthus sonchifolius]|uniref:Uncharacterized protein n=1 Tax=Smallanthus sonchifolius TaxID=185202 RepID=A0ACB8ZCH6_9ASTR|nr:hypothetical protein L1987_78706 [Smallanthus sonchifolius]
MSENELHVVDSDDDDTVCLGESFFIDDNYELTTFTFGSHVLQLFCLQSASTDFDLTGQLVWPGARLLNEYLSNNAELLQGYSAIELGSGVALNLLTWPWVFQMGRGLQVISNPWACISWADLGCWVRNRNMILKKNVELHEPSENPDSCAALSAEKLEWGNSDQLNNILQKHPEGFDLVLGADIYILFVSFQQNSVPLLFDTVKQLLCQQGKERCRFILAYVSRSKMMDVMVTKEAIGHGLQIHEVDGSRTVISNLEGVIYDITL